MFGRREGLSRVLDNYANINKPVFHTCRLRPITCRENDTLADVIGTMLDKKIRKIPVVDKQNNFKGMITSVDVLDILGGGEKHAIFRKNRTLKIRTGKFMTKHVTVFDHKKTLRKALEVFKREGKGLYPVTKKGKLIGVLTEWDIVKRVDEKDVKVYDLMVEKPLTVKRNYTLFDVSKMMCRGGSRRLPVVEKNIPVGVVTPTDIIRYLREKGKESEMTTDRTRIADVMNRDIVTIRPEADLSSAINTMKNKNVGGLLVTDNDELVGIITERDILEAFI